MNKRAGVIAATCALVALAASNATAASANLTQYRAKVNALCRTYTPQLKRVEADMRAAQKAGNVQRAAFDVGVLIGASLAEGTRLERIPVPADARTVMARPLHLLRTVDAHARRLLQAATAGDQATTAAELKTIQRVAPPLNHAFDVAGLRDCGSNQD
jgi:hypothetical protein